MIIQGDCIEVLKTLDENSVDAIVTDPPYELGFMGKSWDNSGIAYNVDMWKECLRVLKPGGHLLSFSGTRTYHRMAVAIEDAGFEVRDMIEWVYGCLSEDTEILTESGYKPLHKLTQYDRIGVYDITNNIYKWERPQGYSVYKVHQDTAYRIKSDYTDQIVSRNHRCLVEREGKLVFVTAEELKEVEYMPTLSEDFYSLQEGHRKLLLKELLRKGKGLAKKLFSKWVRKEMSEQRIEVRKEPSLERWSNLLEETRKLQADKICEVSEGVFTDGEKRWICNGTSFDSGSILGDMFRENPSSASYQSRPTGQPTGKPDVISIKQGTQIIRRARVEKIEYSGIIFCPTVSTGAFIARRNGQVFITGNSGFPKSLNIGKAVDKIQGNDREVVGKKRCGIADGPFGSCEEERKHIDETKGTSEWEGWGTALKPAHEPICMARKPLGQQELDIAKNICYNITEKGLITNSKIIWRIKNVKNAEQLKTKPCSTQTPQQKMVVISAETVETKENESVGKKIQKLIENICESGMQETGNKQRKQVQKVISKTKTEYLDTGESININEKQKPLKHTEESASVVENQDLSSLPLTTLEVAEDGTEKKSKTETSMSSLKSTNTQKTDIDCSALTATSQWVCMDIVRTLKVSFEGKEYDFIELSDGSLVWNENLEPYRKQQKLNVAENVLKYGTGGINIDGCRVGTEERFNAPAGNKAGGNSLNMSAVGMPQDVDGTTAIGRFPANLIHDGSDEVRDCFPNTGKSSGGRIGNKGSALNMMGTDYKKGDPGFGDSGNASRFFKSIIYTAKASKSERNMGLENFEEKKVNDGRNTPIDNAFQRGETLRHNNHPTVKPIALMEYLINMVTREGQIVLDPFAGSGSTLIAAKKLGRKYIGIELEPEYVKIAEARLNSVQEGLL